MSGNRWRVEKCNLGCCWNARTWTKIRYFPSWAEAYNFALAEANR